MTSLFCKMIMLLKKNLSLRLLNVFVRFNCNRGNLISRFKMFDCFGSIFAAVSQTVGVFLIECSNITINVL